MYELPWEDALLERKVESDLKDLLKTLVAFSNSVKPEHKATILIGEKDNGDIVGVKNPDNIQKRIRKECDKIYPPIIWSSKVYIKKGISCIRIEVEHSGDTPHFGGPAWIRKGSETIKASDNIFQKLIELRNAMVNELSKWLNKEVSVHADNSNLPSVLGNGLESSLRRQNMHRWVFNKVQKIISVNRFWITFEDPKTKEKQSEPLTKLTLSFDNENNRLKILVDYY